MKNTRLMSRRAIQRRITDTTDTELDATSHLPVQHDTIGDDEDTGINEILTENMPIEDSTVEMPAAENDEKIVDMPIKSGKVS